MRSAEVDSYLALWLKPGQRRYTGRDNAGGVDAMIEANLDAGVYLVGASTTRPEEEGAFELTIERVVQP